ncbi:MAG: hypothetical protein QM809_15730 [Gordonia sp. (in: high G+C Gram-positive bacteria)]|uniref:hypothetical protein n=1 Tax=Gordonia sp. (in: high G+C Gram-positive bacteria) TaxID=84139 RepID=UPI0039E6CE7D
MPAIPMELKERAVNSVLERMQRDGVNVSRACRDVGDELGLNANTLRKLVAERRRETT